jgi:hypothetical protein
LGILRAITPRGDDLDRAVELEKSVEELWVAFVEGGEVPDI